MEAGILLSVHSECNLIAWISKHAVFVHFLLSNKQQSVEGSLECVGRFVAWLIDNIGSHDFTAKTQIIKKLCIPSVGISRISPILADNFRLFILLRRRCAGSTKIWNESSLGNSGLLENDPGFMNFVGVRGRHFIATRHFISVFFDSLESVRAQVEFFDRPDGCGDLVQQRNRKRKLK